LEQEVGVNRHNPNTPPITNTTLENNEKKNMTNKKNITANTYEKIGGGGVSKQYKQQYLYKNFKRNKYG
jgi:hypothetical protein